MSQVQTAVEYLCGMFQDLLGNWAIKLCGSAIFVTALNFVGGRDRPLEGLFSLLCLDFVLGVAHGWRIGRFSKSKIMGGLAKFMLYYLALRCANDLDAVFNAQAGLWFHVNFRGFLIMYLCLHEALSVLQHLHFFGVPLPAKLLKRLRDYRDGAFFCGSAGKSNS